MWNKLIHDFGEIHKGSHLKTEFVYSGDKEIFEVDTTCNCTKAVYSNNLLKVEWKVKPKPKKSYQSSKTIMIIYKDGSIDDLTLTAYIIV